MTDNIFPHILNLNESESITMYSIGEIESDGTLRIDYRYYGNLTKEKIEVLIESKLNEIFEESIYLNE